MQLYREEGFYLERIYKWMDRVGLESIRAKIEDPLLASFWATEWPSAAGA